MSGAIRRFGRFRWIAKFRLLRFYGVSFRERPRIALRYLFVDPEVGDFSYDIDNVDELASFLAELLDLPRGAVAGYLREIVTDDDLRGEMGRRARWRFDVKRPVGFTARVSWYAVLRAVKPRLVVETGVKHGIGSAVMLRALDRNAAEGSPGELIAIDLDPKAGWIVPERLRPYWRPITGSTWEVLEPAVSGREIDVFVHDTPHSDELERFEFEVAVRHAAETAVLISAEGENTSILQDLAGNRGSEYRLFMDRPKDHFYSSPGMGFAVLRRQ